MIPKYTNRLHIKPYWLGDSKHAIRVAARKPVGADGGKFIDMNFQVCLSADETEYEAVCLHWGTARKNGFYYITYRNKYGVVRRRRMSAKELDRPIHKWNIEEIKRWRRTAKLGTSYASRVKPESFVTLVKYAKKRNVVICAELKSILFARYPEIAVKMKSQVTALRAKVYIMTLVTMRGWRSKLRNFHNAGFETALLAHRAPKPADLSEWRKYIDRIWGRFA